MHLDLHFVHFHTPIYFTEQKFDENEGGILLGKLVKKTLISKAMIVLFIGLFGLLTKFGLI